MAKLQKLNESELEETESGYRLLVSAIGGDMLYVEITPSQMDEIIESLEDALGDSDDKIELQ